MIGTVFNVGSAHDRTERNNTIAKLFRMARNDLATQVCMINDGPPTAFPEKFLKARRDETLQWLKDNGVTKLNMCGHSRGAYLCNMIVKGVANDRVLKRQVRHINIINLDPVKRAALDNCTISAKRNVRRYHVILMLHAQKKAADNLVFPLHVAGKSFGNKTRDYAIRYTIPMPGKHGSGTQCKTSPIGRVTYQMMKRFLRRNGTRFRSHVLTALQFCEAFARIHDKQPLDAKQQRLMFDDDRNAGRHDRGKEERMGRSSKREDRRRELLKRDKKYSRDYRRVVAETGLQRKVTPELLRTYFFNLEHVRHFNRAFPEIFTRLITGRIADRTLYNRNVRKFNRNATLRRTRYILETMLKSNL